jgi:hypothetical protein
VQIILLERTAPFESSSWRFGRGHAMNVRSSTW